MNSKNKFKVGDRVRISKSSAYYGENKSNPSDCIGTVTKYDADAYGHFASYVDWDNGGDNAYRDEDLELVSAANTSEPAVLTVDKEFVMEAYESACSDWRKKIENKFPELFPKQQFAFKGYEIKKRNRFVVTLGSPLDCIINDLIVEVTRPSSRYSLNTGRTEWIVIVKAIDPVAPSVVRKVYEEARSGSMMKMDMKIEILGPCQDVVEVWQIKEAELFRADFGSLNKNDDSNLTVTMEFVSTDVKLLY